MEGVGRDVAILFDPDGSPVTEGDLAEVAAASGSDASTLLRTAIDPVRELVVGDDVVELRGGLVVPGTPSLAAIHADGCTLVHGQRNDVGVVRIDPDGVIVVAARRAFDGSEVLAGIRRLVRRSVGYVNHVFVLRIDAYHGKIIAASPDPLFGIYKLPALSGIVGAIDAAFLLRVHHGIHPVGVAERHGQADATQAVGFARQAFRDLAPGVAAIG